MDIQDIEKQLQVYVGEKGLGLLKKKSLDKDKTESFLHAVLNAAKCIHLKSQLEGCTKLNYQIPATDMKLDIQRNGDLWSGNLISKSQQNSFKDIDNDSLCALAFALTESNPQSQIITDLNFIATIKNLVKSYKPKMVSLTLNKSQFDCTICNSQIDLAEGQLCKCLMPLEKSDLSISKLNDKTKIVFSKNWNQFQLKHVLKLVTKSLLVDQGK